MLLNTIPTRPQNIPIKLTILRGRRQQATAQLQRFPAMLEMSH